MLPGVSPATSTAGSWRAWPGLVLLVSGPVVLWRSRRADGRRWLRRTVKAFGSIVVGVALVWFVVFPIGFAYGYTHIGGIASTTDVGIAAEQVTVTTEDSLDLAAWYIPSRNRAAVILHPGSTRTDQARMLARHGYGVLLLDGRGQGTSEGDAVRWAGDRDLLAGADFLRHRPDVDPHRIGAIGFSVGGELLLEAAAQSTTIRAVVSEGAGTRVGEADVTGPARLLVAPNQAVLTAATAVFANHLPPPPIVERIGLIAPRPLLLIYTEPGMGQEDTRQPTYFRRSRHAEAAVAGPRGRTHRRALGRARGIRDPRRRLPRPRAPGGLMSRGARRLACIRCGPVSDGVSLCVNTRRTPLRSHPWEPGLRPSTVSEGATSKALRTGRR